MRRYEGVSMLAWAVRDYESHGRPERLLKVIDLHHWCGRKGKGNVCEVWPSMTLCHVTMVASSSESLSTKAGHSPCALDIC